MKRSTARENAFIALFELSFGGELEEIIAYGKDEAAEYALDEYGEGLLRAYQANTDSINALIEARLTGWKAQRIPRVNMAVLRLAVAEMSYVDPDIDSVVINEAVELAKKYGGDGDYQFVNGVLGAIAREAGVGSAPTPAEE